jgi:hypothetical protein
MCKRRATTTFTESYRIPEKMQKHGYGDNTVYTVSITPQPHFTPRETTPGTHRIGGWVGLRAGLDTEASRKTFCFRQRSMCMFVCLWHFSDNTNVRFQVLTAASMKFRTVFGDVLPCNIIVNRRFRGSTYLWNVGRQLFYTAVHPRRQFWTSIPMLLL